MDSISTSSSGFSISDIMSSENIIVKIAFIFFALVLFMILLKLCLLLFNKMFERSDSPRLINGMVDGKNQIVFPQDPSNNDAVTIYRSVNADQGIEFTWSVWIYIDNLQYQSGQYRHIFHKGNNGLENNGLNFPNNAPGLYIAPNTNALVVMMNTFKSINEEVTIPDIPLNKWVNVIIRIKNSTMDVYINGTITRSIRLAGVPKQNYGNVYVGMNGGFSGYISNLWYYNYALGPSAIQNIVSIGPNTKMIGDSSGMSIKNPNYLSLRWFFYGAGDMYNPTPKMNE
jgi:hypothetical protein